MRWASTQSVVDVLTSKRHLQGSCFLIFWTFSFKLDFDWTKTKSGFWQLSKRGLSSIQQDPQNKFRIRITCRIKAESPSCWCWAPYSISLKWTLKITLKRKECTYWGLLSLWQINSWSRQKPELKEIQTLKRLPLNQKMKGGGGGSHCMGKINCFLKKECAKMPTYWAVTYGYTSRNHRGENHVFSFIIYHSLTISSWVSKQPHWSVMRTVCCHCAPSCWIPRVWGQFGMYVSASLCVHTANLTQPPSWKVNMVQISNSESILLPVHGNSGSIVSLLCSLKEKPTVMVCSLFSTILYS